MDTTTSTNASPSLTPIRLLVRVTRDAAITAATGREGVTPVALTPEVLSKLTLEQRALCAEMLTQSSSHRDCAELRVTTTATSPLTLPGVDISPAAVVAALRDRLDTEASTRATLARRVEAEGVDGSAAHDILSKMPVAGWYEPRVRAWSLRYDCAATELAARAPNHPVLVALRAALVRRLEQSQAEWVRWYLSRDAEALVADATAHESGVFGAAMREPLVRTDATMALWREAQSLHEARKASEKAAAEAEAAAKETARKAAREAAREALVAYALTVPTLAPAARAGYDVADAALDHLATVVADAVREHVTSAALVSKGDKEAWAAWSLTERNDGTMEAPSPSMIATWENVAATVAVMKAPVGVEISVERIGELDVDGSYPEADDHAPLGFVVYVGSAAPNTRLRAILVPLAPAPAA